MLSSLIPDARAEVLRHIPFGQLARIARVNRLMYCAVAAEIRRRIGPRNVAAVVAPSIDQEMLSEMATGVTDAAAYMPLALALVPKCLDGDMKVIFSRWVRLGLVNCARLVCQDRIQFVHEPTGEQERLLIKIIYQHFYRHDTSVPIDLLDARHFNLFVDMAPTSRVDMWSHLISVIGSNERLPRYDPLFANRLLARWGPSPLLTELVERQRSHPLFEEHGDPLPDDPLVFVRRIKK